MSSDTSDKDVRDASDDAESLVSGLPWHQRGLYWMWISVVVFVLDQATKYAIMGTMIEGRANSKEVLPFFNLTFVYNEGAAFSFLADAGGWQRWFFIGVSVFAGVILVVWLRGVQRAERWISIALTLILGGAIGNLYDRIMWGKVVDFLDFHWYGASFPAFNIADSAITIGAIMMIIDMFWPQSAASKR